MEMRIMDREGDTKHIWDSDNPDEVEAARLLFDSLVKEKKYVAYKVEGKKGEKGEVMRRFDPTAERVIFSPPLVGG
jgi:hypothetical protein